MKIEINSIVQIEKSDVFGGQMILTPELVSIISQAATNSRLTEEVVIDDRWAHVTVPAVVVSAVGGNTLVIELDPQFLTLRRGLKLQKDGKAKTAWEIGATETVDTPFGKVRKPDARTEGFHLMAEKPKVETADLAEVDLVTF